MSAQWKITSEFAGGGKQTQKFPSEADARAAFETIQGMALHFGAVAQRVVRLRLEQGGFIRAEWLRPDATPHERATLENGKVHSLQIAPKGARAVLYDVTLTIGEKLGLSLAAHRMLDPFASSAAIDPLYVRKAWDKLEAAQSRRHDGPTLADDPLADLALKLVQYVEEWGIREEGNAPGNFGQVLGELEDAAKARKAGR